MRLIVTLALFAAACGAPETHSTAQEAPAQAIEIADPWAAATPNGVDVSAGYLTFTNHAEADDTLTSVASARAERVEIHEMTMDGVVMRMRAVEALPAPSGQAVTLAPGGMHIMFYGVAQPFVDGEEAPVRLTFANAGEIEVMLQVRAAGGHDGH